jgi:hypothetical protein
MATITREQRDAARHLANVNRRARHLAAQLSAAEQHPEAQAMRATAESLRGKIALLDDRVSVLTQRLAVLEQESEAAAEAESARPVEPVAEGKAEVAEVAEGKGRGRDTVRRLRGVQAMSDREWEAATAPTLAQAMRDKAKVDAAIAADPTGQRRLLPGSRIHVPTADELAERAAAAMEREPGIIYDLAPGVEMSGDYA